MDKVKVVSFSLANHFKLSTRQSPSKEQEQVEMDIVLYALAVGSLMYSMLCTHLDINHVVGVVS